MDAFKKLFSVAAFLLFLLALVWLFTYDSDVQPSPVARQSPEVYTPPRTERPAISQPATVTTYTPPPPEPTQVTEPVVRRPQNSGTYMGQFGKKAYSRQGQTGTYKGAFTNSGTPIGYGVMEYANGNKFIGEYRNGQRYKGYSLFTSTGKVKYREYGSNGNASVDKNRTDLKVMRSKSYAREGQSGTYSGPFKNNQPHGIGVYSYSNGDIFVGNYSNGLRHGEGTLCKANGKCYKQIYSSNKLLN